jgi:hypothetical protein
MRGASALLTALVLPERPGFVSANLSRQGSTVAGPASSSGIWDLGDSRIQGVLLVVGCRPRTVSV